MAVKATKPTVNRPSVSRAAPKSAVSKPVQKGTNQRVSQAKGLVANVGTYKDAKTLNLTNKQLGAGGQKAATARKIDISKTQYDSTRKQVLGPMGKPITGRVDMGGGNIAVYKNGVRVKAAAAKPRPSGGGTGGGSGTGGSGKPSGGGSGSGNGKGTPMRPTTGTPGSGRGTPMRPVMRRDRVSGTVRSAVLQGVAKGPDKPVIGRDTGNHKSTMYANGTARVWDPKLVKFVTVGKSDSRHPQNKGK